MPCPKPANLLNIVAALLFCAVLGISLNRAPAIEAAAVSTPPEEQAKPPAAPAKPAAAAPAAEQAPATPPPGYAGSEACATCHTGYDSSINASKHGQVHNPRSPAGKLGCESCHGPGEAHMNDPDKVKPKQFTKMSAKQISETCTTCHNKGVHALWKGSQHEARNVSCISCHSIHKPMSTTAQLKAMNQQGTCITCHRDKVAKLDKSGHMPVREGKMECSSCHNPHGTTNVRLLKTGNTVNEACSSCHAEKRGPWLFEHAGINGEGCTTCHDPHGSSNDRMLVAKLPFLCQRCHNHTRHPSTIYDNKVLQSSNRLFGRSCVTCHSAIHGSNHPAGSTFLRQ
ncbi:MAG TPA: DmsE family decaheme c-type cytochrome [Vicinamibacterales bacterium]|jgi:DmsE family decaheme c-type cytochrome